MAEKENPQLTMRLNKIHVNQRILENNIDNDLKILKNIIVLQPFLWNGGVETTTMGRREFSTDTIDKLVLFGNEQDGVKSRYGHPSSSFNNDPLGTDLGKFYNFRKTMIDSHPALIADLHFCKAALLEQGWGTYIMTLAEDMSDAFGASVIMEYVAIEDKAGKNLSIVTPISLLAVDVVMEPAATKGLFDIPKPDTMEGIEVLPAPKYKDMKLAIEKIPPPNIGEFNKKKGENNMDKEIVLKELELSVKDLNLSKQKDAELILELQKENKELILSQKRGAAETQLREVFSYLPTNLEDMKKEKYINILLKLSKEESSFLQDEMLSHFKFGNQIKKVFSVGATETQAPDDAMTKDKLIALSFNEKKYQDMENTKKIDYLEGAVGKIVKEAKLHNLLLSKKDAYTLILKKIRGGA